MPSKRHKKSSDLFRAACDMAPDARAAFLKEACAGDTKLQAEVEALLAQDEQHPSFLESPAKHEDQGKSAPETESVRADRDRPGRAKRLHAKRGTLAGHPERVGPYKILQELGEGGMGVVYLAEQTEPIRRRVALKLIKPGMDTKQVIARFETERQALALMNHPNVAKVLDAGTTEKGRPYFVMEYVKGESITAYCDRHRLTTRERLELFMQVCHAVQHAHQKAIIHRDLKPSNVLVAVEGDKPVPKVIDFGVAKATEQKLTERTLFTEHGQLIGTPEYMSPEQAEMSALDIDTRTDVYSLGVLLYELLVGALPFDSTSLRQAAFAEIQRIIREVEPPKPSTRLSSLGDDSANAAKKRRTDPSTLTKQLRGDLDWIIMKAMDKDRMRRYTSADALSRDIERFLCGEPVEAHPPSTAYKLRKIAGRHKTLVAALASILAILSIATMFSTWQYIIAEAARAETERRKQSTERVAEFQASMLRGIDAERMGQTLLEELHKQIQSGLERTQVVGGDGKMRNRTPEEIETALKGFDALAESINPTDVANRMMDIGILAPAAAGAEADLADEPEVLATLFSTLGAAYFSLGQFEQAEVLFHRALNLRRSLHGEVHPDVASSLLELGESLGGQGDYAAAEPLVREALAINHTLHGDEHPDVAWALTHVAATLRFQGEYAAAEPLFREALAMNRKLLDEDDPFLLNSLDDLASLLQDKGDYAEAETLLREALPQYRKRFGDEHRNVAICLWKLALLLHAKGEHNEGEQLARESLAMYRKLLGDEHSEVAYGLNVLAGLLSAQEKYAEAEPLFREALTLNRRLEGEHPNTAITLHNLADMLAAKGDPAAAEPLFRESLALRRKLLGDEHLLTAQVLHHLAEVMHRLGNFDEAERLAEEAVEIYRIRPDWHPVEYFHALSVLAVVHEDSGKDPEAAQVWAEALDAKRRLTPLLLHPQLASGLARLGAALLRSGSFDEAETALRECLDIHERPLADDDPEDWLRHSSMSLLGEALAEQGRFVEAEALVLDGYSGLAYDASAPLPLDGRGIEFKREALERIVRLYDAWHVAEPAQGHDAKAADWRAKLPPADEAAEPAP